MSAFDSAYAERNIPLSERYIPLSELCALTGLSQSTVRRAVKSGTAPQPARISRRSLRWSSSEIHAWMRSRVTGRVA
jgi:excisionase family DNA binding protein